eukprot:147038-Chlamydomonas_euryale.AAC.1
MVRRVLADSDEDVRAGERPDEREARVVVADGLPALLLHWLERAPHVRVLGPHNKPFVTHPNSDHTHRRSVPKAPIAIARGRCAPPAAGLPAALLRRPHIRWAAARPAAACPPGACTCTAHPAAGGATTTGCARTHGGPPGTAPPS